MADGYVTTSAEPAMLALLERSMIHPRWYDAAYFDKIAKLANQGRKATT